MTLILVAIVTLLVVAAMVQIIRVSELLAELKKENVNDVTDSDNKTQGFLYLVIGFGFLVFVVWQMIAWNDLLLPEAASIHGAKIDALMQLTMTLILVVFFITSPMLFVFAYIYRGKKGKAAYFFAHNNKLEIIWTIVPTIVLTGVIIYGLKTWNETMNMDLSNAKFIEIHSKQFGWTARYSGEDNKLGKSDFRLIDATNALGVDMSDNSSLDDKITREVHLVVNKPVLLQFRSQDIIHSAFLPHFRVQMNCVPGLITQFGFTPTKTTAQMKQEEGDEFNFILLCNKICGSAHYNMQMKFIVETQAEYDAWIAQQKTLGQKLLTKR